MDTGDERKWTADEVSRKWYILSKAVEVWMQWEVQWEPVYWLYGRRHSGGMNFIPGLIMELGNLDIDDGCGKLPM